MTVSVRFRAIWLGLLVLLLAGYAATRPDFTARLPEAFSYLWRTPDQTGADAYARRDFTEAAKHFRNPAWQAAACYRAADYACALERSALLATAESALLMGNAYARMGKAEPALLAFERALSLQPDWPAARQNRDLMRQVISAAMKPPANGDEPGEPTETPDGTVVDERAKRGKVGEVLIEKLDPAAIDKLWLRNVRTDPAAFLRLRFAHEAQQTEAERSP